MRPATILCVLFCLTLTPALAAGGNKLELADVFELEWISDPRVSPDGERIAYVRNFMDIMSDRPRSNIWLTTPDGSNNRPLTSGAGDASSPRFSPDGTKLLFLSTDGGQRQLFLRWLDTGQTTRITNLQHSPSSISWSPDGRWIAFTMLVTARSAPFVKLPPKPEGARWAKPARVIQKLQYRADGAGYLPDGYQHIFLLSSDGGTPRQLTSGDYHHGGPLAWSKDSSSILFAANRHEDWEYDPNNSEIYEIDLQGQIRALTDRHGPDRNPAVSPAGAKIAYLGLDEQYQGYQLTRLYVMNRDGTGSREILTNLDRNPANIQWSSDGQGLFFQYDSEGHTWIAYTDLQGNHRRITGDVGGLSLGRPYAGGVFHLGGGDRFAFTHTAPDHPADLATGKPDEAVRRLTRVNDDLFSFRELGQVEEIWYESSHDGRRIHGWIALPPNFDASRKYPLVLEIHGGPFANYGDRFSTEVQLYAAAGYVVLYTNPRGSTSYGLEFGNLIHHAYPSYDYDDLMSGIDAVVARGYVDPEQLFVTGGSGGGVLSSWIVGKTDRFRAAVVAKPVINWYSFALTADAYNFFYKYWFPGYPWDHTEHYMKRSPISLVGNVTTPTMVLTGEVDYRTPMSESEQYYQALKLRKIDSALVRIPEASHGIAARPSYLISKVAHILGWFEKYRKTESAPAN